VFPHPVTASSVWSAWSASPPQPPCLSLWKQARLDDEVCVSVSLSLHIWTSTTCACTHSLTPFGFLPLSLSLSLPPSLSLSPSSSSLSGCLPHKPSFYHLMFSQLFFHHNAPPLLSISLSLSLSLPFSLPLTLCVSLSSFLPQISVFHFLKGLSVTQLQPERQ